jgi:hypothetical protein
MPSFAKNVKLCLSFAKIWNYAKFCQKYGIVSSFCQNYGNMLSFAKNMEFSEVLRKI